MRLRDKNLRRKPNCMPAVNSRAWIAVLSINLLAAPRHQQHAAAQLGARQGAATKIADAALAAPPLQQPVDRTAQRLAILRLRCEEHAELFVCVIAAAASFQYVRALLGNELGQERRVILNRTRGCRGWAERWSYHWKSVVMSVLGIFGTVLIITQNLWVFVTLTLSYEFAMYRYLMRSPADSARAGR